MVAAATLVRHLEQQQDSVRREGACRPISRSTSRRSDGSSFAGQESASVYVNWIPCLAAADDAMVISPQCPGRTVHSTA